jgi:hypothetical protein
MHHHLLAFFTNSLINDNATCHETNLYEVSDNHITTYYSTQAAHPPSLPLHLSTQSNLNVISTLTCNTYSHWLNNKCNLLYPSATPDFGKNNVPMKGNNGNTPPTYDRNYKAQTISSLTMANLWLPLLNLQIVLYPNGYIFHLTANDETE